MEAPSIRPGFWWSPTLEEPHADSSLSNSSPPCLDEAVLLSNGNRGDALAALFSGCGPAGQDSARLAAALLPSHALEQQQQLTPAGLVQAFHACHTAMLEAARSAGSSSSSGPDAASSSTTEMASSGSGAAGAHSGASGLVLLHCAERGSLVVGSAGACRAVLGRRSPSTGDLEAVELLPDLALGAACLETARLEASSGAAAHPSPTPAVGSTAAAGSVGAGSASDEGADSAAGVGSSCAGPARLVRVDPVHSSDADLQPPGSSAESCISFGSSQQVPGSGPGSRRQYKLTVDGAVVPNVPASRLLGHAAAAAAGVIATPLVAEWRITERDAFVVLGSPALWSVLTEQQVVDYVSTLLRGSIAMDGAAAMSLDGDAANNNSNKRTSTSSSSGDVRPGLSCSDVLTLEAQELLKLAAADTGKDTAAIPGVAAALLLLPGWQQVLARPSTPAAAHMAATHAAAAAEVAAAVALLPAGGRSNSEATALSALWGMGAAEGQRGLRPCGTLPAAAVPPLLPLLAHCPWPLHCWPRERVRPPPLLSKVSASSSDSSGLGTPKRHAHNSSTNSLKRAGSGLPIRASLNRRLSQDLDGTRGTRVVTAGDAGGSRSSMDGVTGCDMDTDMGDDQSQVVYRVRLDGSGELETVLYDSATCERPSTTVARHLPWGGSPVGISASFSVGCLVPTLQRAGSGPMVAYPQTLQLQQQQYALSSSWEAREALQSAGRPGALPIHIGNTSSSSSNSSAGAWNRHGASAPPQLDTLKGDSPAGAYRSPASGGLLLGGGAASASPKAPGRVTKARSCAALTALQAASSLAAQEAATCGTRELLGGVTVSHPEQGLLRSNSCSWYGASSAAAAAAAGLVTLGSSSSTCASSASGSSSMKAATLHAPAPPATFRSAFAEAAGVTWCEVPGDAALNSRAQMERAAIAAAVAARGGAFGSHTSGRSSSSCSRGPALPLEQLAALADSRSPTNSNSRLPVLDPAAAEEQQDEVEGRHRGGLPRSASYQHTVLLVQGSRRSSSEGGSSSRGSPPEAAGPQLASADAGLKPAAAAGGGGGQPDKDGVGLQQAPSPFLLLQLAAAAGATAATARAGGSPSGLGPVCPGGLSVSAAGAGASCRLPSMPVMWYGDGRPMWDAAQSPHLRPTHSSNSLKQMTSLADELAGPEVLVAAGADTRERGVHGGRYKGSGLPKSASTSTLTHSTTQAVAVGSRRRIITQGSGEPLGSTYDSSSGGSPLTTLLDADLGLPAAWQSAPVGVSLLGSPRHTRVPPGHGQQVSTGWAMTAAATAAAAAAPVVGGEEAVELEGRVRNGRHRSVTRSLSLLVPGSSTGAGAGGLVAAHSLPCMAPLGGGDAEGCMHGGLRRGRSWGPGNPHWHGPSSLSSSSHGALSSLTLGSQPEQLGSPGWARAAGGRVRGGGPFALAQQQAWAPTAAATAMAGRSGSYSSLHSQGSLGYPGGPGSPRLPGVTYPVTGVTSVTSPVTVGSDGRPRRNASVEKLVTHSGTITRVRLEPASPDSNASPTAAGGAGACKPGSSEPLMLLERGSGSMSPLAAYLEHAGRTSSSSLSPSTAGSPSDSCVLVGSLSEAGCVPPAPGTSAGSSAASCSSSSLGGHWPPAISKVSLQGHVPSGHLSLARAGSLGPAHGFTLLPPLVEEALPGTSPPTGTSTPSFDQSKDHPGAWNPVEAAAALLAERCKAGGGGGGGSESCSTRSESEASHMSAVSMHGLVHEAGLSTSYRPCDVLGCTQAGSCVSCGGSDLLAAALSEEEGEEEGEVCSSDGLRRCGLMGLRNQSFEFARVPSPAELLRGADV